MHSHRRSAPSRVGLGTFIVGIVLSLMAFGLASPAHAAGDAQRSNDDAATASPRAAGDAGRACGTANLKVSQRCTDTGPPQLSEGGCGFMQRCLYFSRGEQLTILGGGSALMVAAICAATGGLACAAASAIVGAAFQWLNNRGGLCPTSKPRLRIQWFPFVAAEGCVS